jgi:DNA-binding NarL/FixJ family response regulator
VLDLVAAGRENREIAEALTLSVRTVERHLQTVYRKLGLTGSAQRTAAAALVRGASDYARAATAGG